MLSTDQRKSRLEDLLERVLKNKERTGGAEAPAPVAAAVKPAIAAAPTPVSPPVRPKPEPTPLVAPLIEPPTPPEPMAADTEDDDIDFGFADSFQSAPPAAAAPAEGLPSLPADEIAAPPAPAAAPVAAAPAPAAPAAIAPQSFEAVPEASGPVVGVVGDRPENWTINSVLQRAWQFGAN